MPNKALPIKNRIDGGYILKMIPSIGSIAINGKETNATVLKKRNRIHLFSIFVWLFKAIY